jgi:polysaccharide biosynthesis transport protein
MQATSQVPVLSLTQILAMVRARLGLIALVTALSVVTAYVMTSLIPKIYTATAEIYVDFGAADPTIGRYGAQLLDESYLQTQTDIIRSERILAQVMEATQMMESADGQKLAAKIGALAARQSMLEGLGKSLEIVLKKPGRLIEIKFKATDAELAKVGLDAVVNSYLKTTQSITRGPAEARQKQYAEQLEGLRSQMEKAQKELSAYQREHNIVSLDAQLDTDARMLQDMSFKLTETTVNLNVADTKLNSVKRLLSSERSADRLAALPEARVVQDLRGRIETLDAQIAANQSTLGERHPRLVSLRSERMAAQTALQVESATAVSSLTAERNQIAQVKADIEADMQRQRGLLLERKQHLDVIKSLQTEIDSTRAVYNLSLQKYDQFLLTNGTNASAFEVLRWPSKPFKPSHPIMSQNLLFSVPAGLVIGLALALLVELMNRRIRCQADAEMYLGLPVLGRAP